MLLVSVGMTRNLVLVIVLAFGFGVSDSGFAAEAAQPDTYRQAYDAGHEDGLVAGRKDRSSHRPFDFANNQSYQDALRGFQEGVHDRDVYIVAFRRGFEDGYEEGYGLVERRTDESDSVSPPPDRQTALVGQPTNRKLIPKGTEFRACLLETLSTKINERGDNFTAELVRPIEVDSQIVIPEGARVHGTITYLKRAGRIKGRAEMNLRFNEIELTDGTVIPIEGTVKSIEERADEEVKNEEGTLQGSGSKGKDLRKIGTSSGLGALLGALAGGGKGAKIGAATGAIGGLAGVLFTRGDDVVLFPETELVIRLDRDTLIP